jgi:phosphoribosyl-dephospho-CoA transferase
MYLKRHTLLDITDRGRADILAELAGNGFDSAMLRERYAQVLLPEMAGARIPGIVRREEGALRPGCIPVGFSSPLAGSEGRLRMAAFVRQEDVVRTTSPYELMALPTSPPRNACTTALDLANNQAHDLNLDLGVWGSVALELYTGLPCTHQSSDLDLLVSIAPRVVLSQFLHKVKAIEKHLELRIDVELELPNGYGVHLKELFGQGRTIIGKSLNDVTLLPREQILAELPQEEPVKIFSSTA